VTIPTLLGVFDRPSQCQKIGVYKVRRLYSTFRWWLARTGLLLLRVVIGSALVCAAAIQAVDRSSLERRIPAVLAMGAGLLLIAGLWTPIVGTSVALIEIWKIVMLPGD
jgi:hypothetical protein